MSEIGKSKLFGVQPAAIAFLLVVSIGEAVAIVKLASAQRHQTPVQKMAVSTDVLTMYCINELPVSGTDEKEHVYVVTSSRDWGVPGSWMVSNFAHKSLNSAELTSFIDKLPRNTYIEMAGSGASQRDVDALRNRCAKAGVQFAVVMRCLWPRTFENLERTGNVAH